jgi:hypothetical protein
MIKLILQKQKALTLIETILSIFIFSLLIFTVNRFIIFSYGTHGYEKEQAQAVYEARRGVDQMAKDIRAATVAEDGSYPIERADDKQFVFYSDIDSDGRVEKVRYFLGTITAGSQTQECETANRGGTCSVSFFNFSTGDLKSAQVRFSVDGDFDSGSEYAEILADGMSLDDDICETGCIHCAGVWQGSNVFDVTSRALDNSIQFTSDSSYDVQKQCPSANPSFAMKARFELSWAEEVIGLGNELKKGIIEPVGDPVTYPPENEKVTTVTTYVRNDPPIFKYYDAAGNEITQIPARLNDTKVIKVFLVINIDPNRLPDEFQLQQAIELRNLKTE